MVDDNNVRYEDLMWELGYKNNYIIQRFECLLVRVSSKFCMCDNIFCCFVSFSLMNNKSTNMGLWWKCVSRVGTNINMGF